MAAKAAAETRQNDHSRENVIMTPRRLSGRLPVLPPRTMKVAEKDPLQIEHDDKGCARKKERKRDPAESQKEY